MITDFDTLIAAPRSNKIFLVEISHTQVLEDWVAYDGDKKKIWLGDKTVIAVYENGVLLNNVDTLVSLTQGASAIYYWKPLSANPISPGDESENGWLYVAPATGETVYTHTYTLVFKEHYSNQQVTLNNIFYEPIVADIPDIDQKKADFFYGVSIINDGVVKFRNNKGEMDNPFYDLSWVNSEIEIKVGGENLPYSEYKTMFKGKVSDIDFSPAVVRVKFIDDKDVWDDNAVQNIFESGTFPKILSDWIGRPIPMPYGTVYKMPVACINEASSTNTYTFKVADTSLHSIQGVDAVYVNGVSRGYSGTDLSAGTFNLSTDVYTPGEGQSVAADVRGYQSGTVLIENPIDIVRDLSENILDIGYSANWDDTVTAQAKIDASEYPCGLVIKDYSATLNYISDLMKSCFGVFYITNEGKYAISIWSTNIPSAPDSVNELDLVNFRANKGLDEVRYKVRIGYNKNWRLGSFAHTETTEPKVQWKYGTTKSRTVDTLISNLTAAQIFRDRMAMLLEDATVEMRFTSKLILALKNIGDRFNLSWRRRPADAYPYWVNDRLVEIKEIRKDFGKAQIALVVNDLRSIGTGVGHWTADPPLFTAAVGGGEASPWDSSWSDVRKEYAKQNFGYWSDDNGFVDPTDPSTLNISRWW